MNMIQCTINLTTIILCISFIFIIQFNDMIKYAIIMIWFEILMQCYEKLKRRTWCFRMLCYAMVGCEIWTSPYFEKFSTYRSKMIKSQFSLLICNVNIHSLKYKHFKNQQFLPGVKSQVRAELILWRCKSLSIILTWSWTLLISIHSK